MSGSMPRGHPALIPFSPLISHSTQKRLNKENLLYRLFKVAGVVNSEIVCGPKLALTQLYIQKMLGRAAKRWRNVNKNMGF